MLNKSKIKISVTNAWRSLSKTRHDSKNESGEVNDSNETSKNTNLVHDSSFNNQKQSINPFISSLDSTKYFNPASNCNQNDTKEETKKSHKFDIKSILNIFYFHI